MLLQLLRWTVKTTSTSSFKPVPPSPLALPDEIRTKRPAWARPGSAEPVPASDSPFGKQHIQCKQLIGQGVSADRGRKILTILLFPCQNATEISGKSDTSGLSVKPKTGKNVQKTNPSHFRNMHASNLPDGAWKFQIDLFTGLRLARSVPYRKTDANDAEPLWDQI